MMKKILIILSCVLIFAGCGKEEIQTQEEIIRPVRYETVYISGGNRERAFSGIAKSAQESELSFNLGGKVQKMFVKVGDKINLGAKIAKLDQKDFEIQVQQAEAGLNQARAQYNNAKTSYNRTRQLYENNSASKSELDQSRTAFQSAASAVTTAEKQVELAESKLSYTLIKAPFSGTISNVFGEVDENVGAGQPIVVITSEDEMEVDVAIPAALISGIKKGDKVKLNFDTIMKKTLKGVVSEVGIVSQSSTTFPVTVEINSKPKDLKSGMVGDVVFSLKSKREHSIVVPTHAVSEDENGRFAYIAIPQNDNLAKTKRVTVTTGEVSAEGIEIISGLNEGDLIITAGMSKIKSDMTVKLSK
jgi:RND family efflux transporter MFP subunit